MPMKAEKRQKVYKAILEPVMNVRMHVAGLEMPEGTADDIDQRLYRLTREIWDRVKLELGLRD